MRLQTTITDLTGEQWDLVQRTVKTEYEIPQGASRVCLTIEGDLSALSGQRHVEMSLAQLMGLLAGLGMTGVLAHLEVAVAALNLDPLPDTESGQDPLPGTEEEAPMEPGGMFGDGIK